MKAETEPTYLPSYTPPEPQADWPLERLETEIGKAMLFGKRLSWFIGRMINLAEPKVRESGEGWQEWQETRCPGVPYSTIRRWAVFARQTSYEDVLKGAYIVNAKYKAAKSDIPPKKTPKPIVDVTKMPEKDDPKPNDPKKGKGKSPNPSPDPTTPPVNGVDVIKVPEGDKGKADPPKDEDTEIMQSLTRLAAKTKGGLAKIKELVDAMLTVRSVNP